MDVPGYVLGGTGTPEGAATVFRARRGRRRVTVVVADAVAATPDQADRDARLLLRAQRQSRHPLLLDVDDVGFTDDGRPWLATARTRPLAVTGLAGALAATLRAGEALAALHDAGDVHGSVCPAALRVGRDGGVLLETLRLGGVDGTWMAPELFAGGPVTEASDVQALALTLAALHPPAARLAGVRDALAPDPRLRPGVRELCDVLAWVERTEGFAPTRPTGVTLRHVEEDHPHTDALGWHPGVDLLETETGAAPRQVPRRVALLGAAAAVVAASGVVAVAGHGAPAPAPVALPVGYTVVVLDPGTGRVLSDGAITASGQRIGAGGTLRLGLGGDVRVDPVQVRPGPDEVVTRALFAPLVKLDGDRRPVDDGSAARSAAPSADCTSWTFDLKPGVFSDGSVVDAAAYVRGWTRAARPSTHSAAAALMADVSGYPQLLSGAASTLGGVVALDPATLLVHLDAPDCEFDTRTAAPVFSPWAGSLDAADDESPVGDGPFELAGDGSYDLVRNETYSFGAPSHLQGVTVTRYPDDEAVFAAFQAGQIDVAPMPADQVAATRDVFAAAGRLLDQSDGSVTYLAPAAGSAGPLDDVRARQAVSAAVDRAAVVDAALAGAATPASSLVPPAFADLYQPGLCATCLAPDPVLARSLARQAGLLPGTEIRVTYDAGTDADAWTSVVAQQLHDVLGVVVVRDAVTGVDREVTNRATGVAGLFAGSRAAQLNQADTLFAPLHAGADDDVPLLTDPAIDDRLAQEGRETAAPSRTAEVRALERQAIGTDLVVVPLWFGTRYAVFDSSRFADVHLDADGNPDLLAVHLS